MRSRQSERQHVVAVPALVLLLVDLDQVVEAEHAAGERPVPEEVVERGEEHRRRGLRRVEVGAGRRRRRARRRPRPRPARACRPRRARRRTGRIRATPPRSRQCSTTPASVSAPRAATAFGRERPQPLRLGRNGRVEHLLRDHALGQVVEPLEPLPARDHEVAVVPEPVEHRLRRLPVPHPALRSRPRSGASRAARAPGSRPGSPRRGGGASRRRRRTTCGRPAASARRRAATPRPGSRHASWAQYSKTRPLREQSRHGASAVGADAGARARSGGCARRPRSSRAGRTRAAGSPPPPRGPCRPASGRRTPGRRSSSRRSATRETVRIDGILPAAGRRGRGGRRRAAWHPRPCPARDYLAVATWTSRVPEMPGERRVALAVGLDEELHAVAVLEREARGRVDRVGDLPVLSPSGRPSASTSGSASSGGRRTRCGRSSPRVSLTVIVTVIGLRARLHRVRAERDRVDDQPLALRDVDDVDRLAAAGQVDDPAAAAAEVSVHDRGLRGDRRRLAARVLGRDLDADRERHVVSGRACRSRASRRRCSCRRCRSCRSAATGTSR